MNDFWCCDCRCVVCLKLFQFAVAIACGTFFGYAGRMWDSHWYYWLPLGMAGVAMMDLYAYLRNQ